MVWYGHQLLAHALGGEVGDNPNGLECGTIRMKLHNNNGSDELFGALSTTLRMHLCHRQSVLRLPENARPLAAGSMDSHQAFVVGDQAWGVQFHPEFDPEILAGYIEQMSQDLRREGQDPDRLLAGRVDIPCGSTLLQRFAAIVDKVGKDNDG